MDSVWHVISFQKDVITEVSNYLFIFRSISICHKRGFRTRGPKSSFLKTDLLLTTTKLLMHVCVWRGRVLQGI